MRSSFFISKLLKRYNIPVEYTFSVFLPPYDGLFFKPGARTNINIVSRMLNSLFSSRFSFQRIWARWLYWLKETNIIILPSLLGSGAPLRGDYDPLKPIDSTSPLLSAKIFMKDSSPEVLRYALIHKLSRDQITRFSEHTECSKNTHINYKRVKTNRVLCAVFSMCPPAQQGHVMLFACCFVGSFGREKRSLTPYEMSVCFPLTGVFNSCERQISGSLYDILTALMPSSHADGAYIFVTVRSEIVKCQ